MQSSNNELFLKSGGISLKLICENKKLLTKIIQNDFFEKYIPGFNMSVDTYAMATLELLNEEVSFNFETFPEIKIGINGLNEKDIISLIELVFERARQEAGIYCIHSACSIYQNKAVIFWGGASGMGKTRLARLLADNNGVFYSDEKTLINAHTLEVTGGVPYLYLDKKFWSNHINNKNNDSYYKTENSSIKSIPIGLFIYGFGIDGSDFSCDLWKPEKFEWHLYEELSRKIRAVSRRVKNGDITVPSIDSRQNGDSRIHNVRNITKTIPCYSLQGSPESVITFIKKLKYGTNTQ